MTISKGNKTMYNGKKNGNDKKKRYVCTLLLLLHLQKFLRYVPLKMKF